MMFALNNENYAEVFPTIRIQKIILENFKSVKHGEITFHCGKQFIPRDVQSDILGIYGQNGSGKTSLVEALAILKYALCGRKIPDSYSDCISKWATYSRLSFTFEMQYSYGLVRKAVYSFSLKSVEKSDDSKDVDYDEQSGTNLYKSRVIIFDEVVSMSGDFENTKKPLKPIIDASSKKEVFEPKSKLHLFISGDKDLHKSVILSGLHNTQISPLFCQKSF